MIKRVCFIILALFLVGGFNACVQQVDRECTQDSDCVPAQCCHPTDCVAKENAPDCKGIFCTQECQPNTMDCNQGACECINNKCAAELY